MPTSATASSANPAAAAGEKWTEYIPLNELVPADHNPKLHDIPGIKRSLREFGYVGHGSIDERTGKMVIGHGRHEALVEMHADGDAPPRHIRVLTDGRWAVPVDRGWASENDDQAEALLVADNMWTIRGGWDNRELAEMMSRLAEVQLHEVAGFTTDQLDDLNTLVDDDAWTGGDTDSGGGDGEPDDTAFWPKINMRVPPTVFDAWRVTLDKHIGADDVEKLTAHLRGLGHL